MTVLERFQRDAHEGFDHAQIQALIQHSRHLRAQAVAEFFGHPIQSLRNWFS